MPVKKVLIIDDSPTERYILTEILNRGGYQVITAENGEEGVNTVFPGLVNIDSKPNRAYFC